MKIGEFIKKTFVEGEDYQVRSRIICKDGFSMSVQASYGHYCQPRINTTEYFEFEIGFPIEEESLILMYAENQDEPTNTVYGYVPEDIVNEVLEKHGGIDEIKTFNP